MMWASLAVCVIALTTQVQGWADNDFTGITQVALVVSNLEEATNFYKALGGMDVPKLSTDGIWGDSHYYRMFQTEILQSQSSGVTLENLGVLDIRDNGTYKLRWNMIMFGNFMLQLMQYVRRDTGAVWTTPHPDGNGAAFVTLQHLALWGQNNMNLSDLATELRTQFGPGTGYSKPFVINSMNAVSDRQQQYVQPVESLLQIGDQLIVTDGTQSERLELSKTTTQQRQIFFKQYCDHKAATNLIVDNWKSGRSLLESWYGVNHIGVVGNTWNQSTSFYTEVLGGKTVFGFATEPSELGEFQDDLLDAAENSRTRSQWGIPEFSNANLRQQISFIAFENTYLEPNYFYYKGATDDPDSGTPLLFNWQSLSPAYTRTIIAGFGVKPGLDLDQVVQKIEQNSASLGMSNVKGNRAVAVTSASQTVPLSDYSTPLTQGDLEGYNYILLRGPSQEPLFFVSYTGKARAALKEAMLAYGAKSAQFDETNPWKEDGFKSEYCCSNWNMCELGKSDNPESSGTGVKTWASYTTAVAITIAAVMLGKF